MNACSLSGPPLLKGSGSLITQSFLGGQFPNCHAIVNRVACNSRFVISACGFCAWVSKVSRCPVQGSNGSTDVSSTTSSTVSLSGSVDLRH